MSVGEALTLASVLVLVITGIFIFLQVRALNRNIGVIINQNAILADQSLAADNHAITKLFIDHPDLEVAVLLPELAGLGSAGKVRQIASALLVLDFLDDVIGLRNARMVPDDWWEDWDPFLTIWLSSPFLREVLSGPLGQQYSHTVGKFYEHNKRNIEDSAKRQSLLDFYRQ